MQPLRHLLRVALRIQRQQAGEHVVVHGIGPALVPGEFAAAGDGAVGLELAQEVEGVACIAEEHVAFIDALLQIVGVLGVDLYIEVVEAEAAGGVVGVGG
jgi:hypothetical protein